MLGIVTFRHHAGGRCRPQTGRTGVRPPYPPTTHEAPKSHAWSSAFPLRTTRRVIPGASFAPHARRRSRRPSMDRGAAVWTELWTGWGFRGVALWMAGSQTCGYRCGSRAPTRMTCADTRTCLWIQEKFATEPVVASRHAIPTDSRSRRSSSECAPKAHSQRLPRRRSHRRAASGAHVTGGRAPLGRGDGRAPRRARPAGTSVGSRTARTSHPSLGPVLERASAANQRAVGVEPRLQMGIVHCRGQNDPAVRPVAGRSAVRRRLRPAARARSPHRARSRACVLGRAGDVPPH